MELLDCEHKYTINPITGRKIRVGGKVFLKLLLELGYYYDLKKNYIGKEDFEVFTDSDDDYDCDEFGCDCYDSIYGSEFL